jgi:hypothetical protein
MRLTAFIAFLVGIVLATPALAQSPRTSSFEVGVAVFGEDAGYLMDVPSAKSCEASCLAQRGCGAWRYVDDTETYTPSARRRCFFMRAETDRMRRPGFVSGVISR